MAYGGSQQLAMSTGGTRVEDQQEHRGGDGTYLLGRNSLPIMHNRGEERHLHSDYHAGINSQQIDAGYNGGYGPTRNVVFESQRDETREFDQDGRSRSLQDITIASGASKRQSVAAGGGDDDGSPGDSDDDKRDNKKDKKLPKKKKDNKKKSVSDKSGSEDDKSKKKKKKKDKDDSFNSSFGDTSSGSSEDSDFSDEEDSRSRCKKKSKGKRETSEERAKKWQSWAKNRTFKDYIFEKGTRKQYEIFRSKFVGHCNILQLPKDRQAYELFTALRGDAVDHVKHLVEKKDMNVDKMLKCLDKVYRPPDYQQHILMEFNKTKRKEDQSMYQLYQELESLYTVAYPEDTKEKRKTEVRNCMLRNMDDEDRDLITPHLHEKDGRKLAQIFDRIITQQKLDGRTVKGRVERVTAVKAGSESDSRATKNGKGPKKGGNKKNQDTKENDEEAEVAMQQAGGYPNKGNNSFNKRNRNRNNDNGGRNQNGNQNQNRNNNNNGQDLPRNFQGRQNDSQGNSGNYQGQPDNYQQNQGGNSWNGGGYQGNRNQSPNGGQNYRSGGQNFQGNGFHRNQGSFNNGGYNNPQSGGYNGPQGGGYNNPQGGGYNSPQGGGYNGPQSGGFGNGYGSGVSRNGGNSGSWSNSKKNVQCSYCLKWGHDISECRLKKQEDKLREGMSEDIAQCVEKVVDRVIDKKFESLNGSYLTDKKGSSG